MDDARLGDGMDLNTIAIELRAIREKLGSIESLESKMESLESKMESFESKMESFESKMESFESKMESFESKVDSLDARMRIGFEETHRLIKLGFESVQILDEKIDRRFNETERQHADHKTLIEAAIGSLGRDVRSPAGPAARRRR